MSVKHERNIIHIFENIDNIIPKNHDSYKVWQNKTQKLLSSICYVAPENESYKWLKLASICNECFDKYETEEWVSKIKNIIAE